MKKSKEHVDMKFYLIYELYIISNILIFKNVLKLFSGYLPDDNSEKNGYPKVFFGLGIEQTSAIITII